MWNIKEVLVMQTPYFMLPFCGWLISITNNKHFKNVCYKNSLASPHQTFFILSEERFTWQPREADLLYNYCPLWKAVDLEIDVQGNEVTCWFLWIIIFGGLLDIIH